MRQIKSVSTSMVFDIPAGPAIRWQANVSGSLTGCSGRIWLTKEGDRADYWIEPGMSVAVDPGDVLWVTSESEGEGRMTLHFAAAPTRSVRAWTASLISGLHANRRVGTRHAARR